MSAIPTAESFTVHGNAVDEPLTLSQLEWRVVSLALEESEKGGAVSEPGMVRRFFQRIGRALFGIETSTPLADPRLETLRRFICTSRWGHRDAVLLAQRLMDFGFSQRQVRAVAMLVGR
jgi:hypothetical protein